MNRHYLKMSVPLRIATLSVPISAMGIVMTPDAEGLDFLAAAMGIATSSVDRLAQIPARLLSLFQFDAETSLGRPGLREEMRADDAERVVRSLAEELTIAPRLDRERFRAVANTIKVKTGQKGKSLFHPIRIALTGRTEGPELDLLIPAIERGELPASAGIPAMLGCRERAAAFVIARSPQP